MPEMAVRWSIMLSGLEEKEKGKMSGGIGKGTLTFNTLLCLDTYVGRRRMDKLVAGYRKRNLDSFLTSAGPPTRESQPLARVPTVTDLKPEDFHLNYLTPMRPVVMKGLAKHFLAIGKWSPEFFKVKFGNQRIFTVDGKDRRIRDYEKGAAEFHTAEVTVAEHVDQMLAGKPSYLAFWTELLTENPELLSDLDVSTMQRYAKPTWWSPNPVYKFFMGGPDTSTGWHCAEIQNLFLQIHGTKRWLMCAPEFTPCLDPRVVSLKSQYCHSTIDFRDPDLERYPLYRHAPLEEAILEPGDVLYIPPFYWHCVANMDTTIALAWWWYNLMPAFKAHPTLFWLTVLSPQHIARAIWKRVWSGGAYQSSVTSIFGSHDHKQGALRAS